MHKEEECNVLTILMSSPIVIFAVLLNNRISGMKTYLRIQPSRVLRSLGPDADGFMQVVIL